DSLTFGRILGGSSSNGCSTCERTLRRRAPAGRYARSGCAGAVSVTLVAVGDPVRTDHRIPDVRAQDVLRAAASRRGWGWRLPAGDRDRSRSKDSESDDRQHHFECEPGLRHDGASFMPLDGLVILNPATGGASRLAGVDLIPRIARQ